MLSNSYDHQLINYLVIYSETIDDGKKIHRNIQNFLFAFLKDELPKKINVDPNLTQKVNVCQIVLTRLAFRDDDTLTKCVPMLANTLNRRGLADSIAETAIKCLGDLCKKHTQSVEAVIPTILLKTQSDSAQVRKCAIESLASLVLEDYLKFRGSLLLYVLAATADKKNNIARLEVINCYMYFENFSTLKDRINRKDFKKTPEVLQSIADFLYICEHICKSKEMPKARAGGATEKLSDEEGDTTSANKAVETGTAGSAPTTNKRRGQQTTLPEAMVIVEKTISRFPELSGTLTDLDPNFKVTFDQVCYAIGEHFGDNIKYFPHLFWDKYRKVKPAKRVRRKNENDDDESDENDANTSKFPKTPKRNVEPRSVKTNVAYENVSINDVDDNTNTPIVTKPSKRTANEAQQQRSSRKNVKSMVIDDSDSDSDGSKSTRTPKTPRRNAGDGQRIARKAIKNMVIHDSDSGDDFESVKRNSTKSPRSFVKDKKRTPRRSKLN